MEKTKKKKKSLDIDKSFSEYLEKCVQKHEKFYQFINAISFENYIKNYANPIEDADRGEAVPEDPVEENALLFKIAKAISNPKVIQLINSLLSEND